MSKERKSGPSCLGLFLKSWIFSAATLSCGLAAVVALGVRLLGWNAQAWTDFGGWGSYPIIALIVIGSLSTVFAFAAAAFLGLASAFLSKDSGKARGSGSRPRSRPQSQRKTTV